MKKKNAWTEIEEEFLKKAIIDRKWDAAKAFFENRWLSTTESEDFVGREVALRQQTNNRKIIRMLGNMTAFYEALLDVSPQSVEAMREAETLEKWSKLDEERSEPSKT